MPSMKRETNASSLRFEDERVSECESPVVQLTKRQLKRQRQKKNKQIRQMILSLIRIPLTCAAVELEGYTRPTFAEVLGSEHMQPVKPHRLREAVEENDEYTAKPHNAVQRVIATNQIPRSRRVHIPITIE
jgi:hypothetical protein